MKEKCLCIVELYNEKIKPLLEAISLLVSIAGFVIVIFVFFKNMYPGTVPKAFTKKVYDIRLGQNYDFLEKCFGIPNMSEPIEYTTIDGKNETGIRNTYYTSDYILISYFDCNKSIFGYVVISNNKYFKPKIPNTNNFSNKMDLQILKKVQFKQVNPINYNDSKLTPTLSQYVFFARSGSKYIEQYYAEIYDLQLQGFLGLAITDCNNSNSKLIKQSIQKISEISYPSYSNKFYQKYKEYFKGFEFYTKDSEVIKNARKEVYSKTNIDKEMPNSFFLFSQVSRVDTKSFIEKNLKNKYFIDNMVLLQQK